MAVGATNPAEIELAPELDTDNVQKAAAELYGRGYSRPQIARALQKHLVGPQVGRNMEQRLQRCRQKLKKWETRQHFRDMVYATAVIELDMSTPAILRGIAKKGKGGRVDAARLVLELTGRHNPKGEQAAPNVLIAIGDIPRPVIPEGGRSVLGPGDES